MDNRLVDILNNMKKVIVGKDELLENIMICLLSSGHILLEGLPGTGKTKLALTLAQSLEGKFKRVQFTPDVLPSDITGFCLWQKETGDFEYKEGAAMCHILLADEINRASPRVQSSLLEAMEEGQVTVESVKHALPKPFMVIATENKLDSHGTYPLPEAQLDRFFMKLETSYPSREEWRAILERFENEEPLEALHSVTTMAHICKLQEEVKAVVVSDAIRDYILNLIEGIMAHEAVQVGVSPRGSIALLKAAKARAFMKGRQYALPDDVQKVALPVLSHRILLEPSSVWENITAEDVITSLLKQMEPPIF